MATKVFCNICDTYIKDVTVNEAYNLTGKEVCVTCKTKVNEFLKEFRGIFIEGISSESLNIVASKLDICPKLITSRAFQILID